MIYLTRFSSRRFLSTIIDLGSHMKRLNDNGQFHQAIMLYDNEIRKENRQGTTLAVNQALKACIELADIERGKDIHKNLSPYMTSNHFIQSNLIRLYMKCGDYETSKQIFLKSKNKTTPMLNNILKGLVDNNLYEEALNLFKESSITKDEYTLSIAFKICAEIGDQHSLEFGKLIFNTMPKKYHNDIVITTAALHMFIKCDSIKTAEVIFNRMNRDRTSYGLMMKYYNMQNQSEKTLELFEKMKEENLNPNEIIFILLIDAYSKIGDISLSQSLIDQMPEKFLLNPWIQNGLINLWGKVGLPLKSKEIFDLIQHPDHFSFSAMINAYGLNGMGNEAIQLFNQIPSNLLDNCIYVCILNACSHSALVDQAQKIFEKIPSNQKIDQIYTAMVDTLARVFQFDQALKLIDEYEKCHSPYMPMYMSILSSTRNAKDISLAEKTFQRMELNFANDQMSLMSAGILLANTYGLNGNKSVSSNIRTKLNESNIKRVIGCSWTVVHGKVYKFHAHDRSHPRSSEIYQELDRLTKQLIEHGYKHDESWITRELIDDETAESVLWGHSERIAIAFNLIQRPLPTRIQIVKNLRICGDCHLVTKLIAQIHQCLIVVRDANRIHHFYPDGTCSCQDHF